jgi:hypothetical protein
MRSVQLDIVRVKAGYDNEFREAWRNIVAAHTQAKMDEHWSVYEVDAGMPDTTFLFFYPMEVAGRDRQVRADAWC